VIIISVAQTPAYTLNVNGYMRIMQSAYWSPRLQVH